MLQKLFQWLNGNKITNPKDCIRVFTRKHKAREINDFTFRVTLAYQIKLWNSRTGIWRNIIIEWQILAFSYDH